MDKCRICKNTEMKPILSGLQTRLGEVYSLMQCSNCTFISTHPLPGPKVLKRYYDQDYWQDSGGKSAGLLDTFFKLRMYGILKAIKKMVPPGSRVLDWGAGDGSLLRLLEAEGFDGVGIDFYSTESSDQKLINSSIQDAPFQDGSFDAITSFHVLEHIDKPVSSIKKAIQLLKPGGILIFEVPNVESFGFKLFKENWYPLDIPVHINHFSRTVLERILDIVGSNQILRIDHFSHRHSPSSILLSIFPAISPLRVRAKHSGRFPAPLMVLYLFLQLIAYPFPLFEALMHRGEILRMYVQKAPSYR
jgi:2-polyprenyl-3-methyl-5-hydroxy-6-metoxy-1,4-benzoquinol methylase